MPLWLNNLGGAYQAIFERTGDLSHLSGAISAQQRAIQLTPNGHPDMPRLLYNLANSFQSRFARLVDLADVSKAISFHQRAVELTPDGHLDMPSRLHNLANSFGSRFSLMGDSSDSNTAIKLYKKSATSLGSPSVRLTAARHWAQFTTSQNHPEAMEAYGIAIDLISQVVGMDRTVQQRHTDLVNVSSLTTEAASFAFSRDGIEKALEWLEQGRCLVWGQLNQLRAPVDELRAHDTLLAQRFLEVASTLEASGSRHGLEILSTDAPMSQKMTL